MKKILALCLVFILLFTLTACVKDNKLSIKFNNSKVILQCSKDYILRQGLFNDDLVMFSIFDNQKTNFAVGYVGGLELFDSFKKLVNEVTVYENTDNLLYYSCTNDEDNTKTEYDRVIKLENCSIIIASFDKQRVDDFYASLEVEEK